MATTGDINNGWALTFVLALVALALVTFAVPRVKQLAIGKDNRVSTSKVQVLLWTYAVAFAIFTLFFAFVLVELGDFIGWAFAERLETPLGERFEKNFLEKGLDETYLLLLGLPAGAAVAARAITTTKVANGTIVKPDKEAGSSETSAASELVGDDRGNTDLLDFQYLLFNLLAIAYFLVQFLAHPSRGLPDMPDTLVALTGVAAAAYVAKKGVYREPPILYSIDPPEAAAGTPVTVHGDRLLGAAAKGATTGTATVLFGRTPGRLVTEGDDAPTTDRLVVEVPRRATEGATEVKVVRPPGAESDRLPFEVLDVAPAIRTVIELPIRLGADVTLTIRGSGFLGGLTAATGRNAVTLGGRRLTVPGQWSDIEVVAELPRTQGDVEALGLAAGIHDLVVHDAHGNPSPPLPVTVERTS